MKRPSLRARSRREDGGKAKGGFPSAKKTSSTRTATPASGPRMRAGSFILDDGCTGPAGRYKPEVTLIKNGAAVSAVLEGFTLDIASLWPDF